MSDATTAATEEKSDFESVIAEDLKTVEMTRKEFMQKEHAVQTGISETLPDGTPVRDVQENLLKMQSEQEAALRERFAAKKEKTEAKPSFLEEKVSVAVAGNGVSNATAFETPPANPSSDQEPNNDLPKDFPGRKAMLEAGIVSLEAIAKMDSDALVAVKGIKAATAEQITNYGKVQ